MYNPLCSAVVMLLPALAAHAAILPNAARDSSSTCSQIPVAMAWYANWESADSPSFGLSNMNWTQYTRVSYSFLYVLQSCSCLAIVRQVPIRVAYPIACRELTASQTISDAQYADDITNFVQQAHAHVSTIHLVTLCQYLTSSNTVCQYVNHNWWLDRVSVLFIRGCNSAEQKHLRRCLRQSRQYLQPRWPGLRVCPCRTSSMPYHVHSAFLAGNILIRTVSVVTRNPTTMQRTSSPSCKRSVNASRTRLSLRRLASSHSRVSRTCLGSTMYSTSSK